MEKYEFKRINDVEVLTHNTRVLSNVLGTKKTNTDIMLMVMHQHSLDVKCKAASNNEEPTYYDGHIHVFLTKEQAIELHKQLEQQLDEIL